jgi:transcriptional regulator with XRE-family HTH domain
MLLQARVGANQTVDAMAVLLSMTPEQYEQLESGKYPDDETLRRLCKMMSWNYYEAQRLIINEMISPHPKVPPGVASRAVPPPVRAGSDHAPGLSPAGHHRMSLAHDRAASGFGIQDHLSTKLREARLRLGQSKDILAMLLNCSVEDYERFEDGESPPDEVLRRMCVVFNWNYLDLVDAVRSQQAYVFQPRLPAPAYAGSTALLGRLNQIVGEISTMFSRLSHADQQTALAQLELVRDTMRRHQVRPSDGAASRPSA